MDRGPEQTFFQRGHTDGQQAHKKMFNITVRQMQIKTTRIYITSHLSNGYYQKQQQQQISVGEDVVKREHSCTVSGNESWYSHHGKQYGGSSKN